MANLATYKTGKSVTLGLLFPITYNPATAENISVWIGGKKYAHTIISQMVRCELSSDQTAELNGAKEIYLFIDDPNMGVDKHYLGEITFDKNTAYEHNNSVNTGYDITISLSITETEIAVDDVLFDYVKGANGTNGRGITNIVLISTVGLVKTYRITYTDSTTVDYEVKDGDDGDDGYTPQKGTDYEDGADGKSVELQKTVTHVQWKQTGGSWANLIALTEITGANGKEVELQVAGGYIQWRLTGGSWANLIQVSTLVGATGKSAYQSYFDTTTDNPKLTEGQWSAINTIDVTLKIQSDITTLTTGDGKFIWTIPSKLNGYNLTSAHGTLTTVSSSGLPAFKIYNLTKAVEMLSTNITIDANEFDSYTALTPPVINNANKLVNTSDRLRFDVVGAGTGAKGLGFILTFTKA